MSTIKISSQNNFRPIRIFGVVFLCMGLAAVATEEPFSTARLVAMILISYVFWGIASSTVVDSDRVIKKRGWFFPYFKSEYTALKRIELRSKYIYQEGYGAQSYFALYVGVVNGPFNQFVDLSWGVEETADGEGYRKFVEQLAGLTGLQVIVTDEFNKQFELRYGSAFSASPEQ